MNESARALAEHNPPRSIWVDEARVTRFRCHLRRKSERHPACPGCQQTAQPPKSASHWQGVPLVESVDDRKARWSAEHELGRQQ